MRPVPISAALALMMLAAGCRKAPEAARPSPLRLEAKSFERLVPGCGDLAKREQPCVTYRVRWVEVAGAPDPVVRTKLNTAIRSRLQPADAPAGFEAEAAELAEEFRRFHDEFPGSGITYFVRRTAEVSYSNAALLSIEFNEDDFRGGAHPNARREYLNLSPATGSAVPLRELLVPGGEAKLTALAEAQFRAAHQIAPGGKLSEAGFTFARDQFTLSRTWGVTDGGLAFHYNEYEVAPHAIGATTLRLPWSEIRDLVRKEAGLAPAE